MTAGSTTSEVDHEHLSPATSSSANSSPSANEWSDYVVIPADSNKDLSGYSSIFKLTGGNGEMAWDRSYWNGVEGTLMRQDNDT